MEEKMSKKHKTSTGALHPSIGFPGTNNVHNRVNPELVSETIGKVSGNIYRVFRIGNSIHSTVSMYDATGPAAVDFKQPFFPHKTNKSIVNKKSKK